MDLQRRRTLFGTGSVLAGCRGSGANETYGSHGWAGRRRETSGGRRALLHRTATGRYSSTSPASEGLFRQVIFDSYAKLASGAGSAPLKVGVKFETFRQGARTTNRVSVDPGRGARRVTDAAPPNTALYPVDATYIVCEEYYDGRKRRRISQDFYCFQDRFQDWVCGSGERFPQFTQLKD